MISAMHSIDYMMRKFLFTLTIAAAFGLAACSSNPSSPHVSAGASHSVPFKVGDGKSGWLTNAVRFYPWSKGRKVRVGTSVGVKPTPNTNIGVGVGW